MDRLLVSMDARHGAWEALSRAVSLGRRINAVVYALMVLHPAGKNAGTAELELETSIRRRLELAVQAAKAEGVDINLFIAEGHYESEVIKFVRQHRINLLVAEHGEGESRGHAHEPPAILKIRHSIGCPVELVSPRRNHERNTKDDKP